MSISVMVDGIYRDVNANPSISSGYTEAIRNTYRAGGNPYFGYLLESTSWTGTKEFLITKDNKIVCKGNISIASNKITLTVTEGAMPDGMSYCSYGQHFSFKMHLYFYGSVANTSTQTGCEQVANIFIQMANYINYSVYYK